MSEYFDPKVRLKIADVIEKKAMSEFTGLPEEDPGLSKMFGRMTGKKNKSSTTIFVNRHDIPYALARVSFTHVVKKSGMYDPGCMVRDKTGKSYSFAGARFSHACEVLRGMSSIRKGSRVTFLDNETQKEAREIELGIRSLFDAPVRVLVLSSPELVPRLDDQDLDPEEEGGIGGRYFYGKDASRMDDFSATGMAYPFDFDAVSFKARWINTTYIRAAGYAMSGNVHYQSQKSKYPVSERMIAFEMVGRGAPGEEYLERYARRMGGNVDIVESILEGDRILKQSDLYTLANMALSARSIFTTMYSVVQPRGHSYSYILPNGMVK